jgi:hypothetical protein
MIIFRGALNYIKTNNAEKLDYAICSFKRKNTYR